MRSEEVPRLVGRGGRRVRRTDPDVLRYPPFITVTPNGEQVSINRDALVALGRPSHVVWHAYGGRVEEGRVVGNVRIRLVATNRRSEESRTLSYCGGRPQAITTVPPMYRSVLPGGKYLSVDYPKPGQPRGWIEISPRSRVPRNDG